jgi:O-6-methylguanine DNA methyltransferase
MTEHRLKVGPLSATVTLDDGKLHAVTLPETIPDDLDAQSLTSLIAELAEFPFELSDAPPFTGKVWKRLMRIPAGSAMTYAELAADLGNPRAVRAVGQACATNRRLLVIPCHRIVGADGIGGFALGLDWKRKLLELEAQS